MGKRMKPALSGGAAGLVNGFFGGGGGMVLLPLLTRQCGVDERRAFANCVAVILPLCALSAAVYWWQNGMDVYAALPYLIGGLAGGALGGRWFSKVPVVWLRRIFAAFLFYGGVRYLL